MQGILNLMPVLLDELWIVVGYHTSQQWSLFVAISLFAGNLQQQALLQRTSADASRVEGLQFLEHLLDGFLAEVHVLMDVEVVADAVEALAQISIAIERTDEVFHDELLLLGELQLTHLLLQLVVERCCIAKHHLLIVGSLIDRVAVRRGHLVITTNTLQCHLECILAVLALRGLSEVIRRIAALGYIAIVRPFSHIGWIGAAFQGRVVVELHADAVLELRQRHLQQAHHLHLLLCEALLLSLLKLLFLYVSLCHDFFLL